jgi:hypothetical protein
MGSCHAVARHFFLNAEFFIIPVINLFPARKKEQDWA